MFEKGGYIVYGTTGVCQVEEITGMKMKGASGEKLYYIAVIDVFVCHPSGLVSGNCNRGQSEKCCYAGNYTGHCHEREISSLGKGNGVGGTE